jgi:hypothetical protein
MAGGLPVSFDFSQNLARVSFEPVNFRLVLFHPAENLAQRSVAFVNRSDNPACLAAGQFDVQYFLHDT